MSRRSKLTIAAGVVALMLALTAGVVFTAPPEINWSVFGSGGNASSSTNYAMGSTSGQAAPIGDSGSTNYDLCAGFWCGAGVPATPTPTATATATATATPTMTETPTITPTPSGPTPTPTKQPAPGDTDGDGCADVYENGPDPAKGGLRDYKYPWDYYDVSIPRDGVIDLPNDILGVILHFSPGGLPPYDVNFDRGQQIGANHWERDVPDGVIDLPNDILGVILQFNAAGCRL